MANSISALKRVRQTKSRTLENRAVKTRLKSTRKAALEALASGDAGSIDEAVKAVYSAADRAAKSGAIHAKASSRIKARLAARIAATSA